jgi:two-component system CheB/CheR fusion protein
LIGRDVKLLIPTEYHGQAEEARRRCLKSENVRNEEAARVSKSGESYPVLLTLSRIVGEDEDDAIAIASIAKDIRRLKEVEGEAREAVRRRDHFLAMLSHELRNPLGAILNATRVMQRQAEGEVVCADVRSVIERQSRQMARLLDDLLDVSRITQGKIEIRGEVFDLRRAAKDALDSVRPLIESRDQQLSVEREERPLCVRGDAARLQQIQVNLLNNASKYTPPKGRITFRLEREGNEAVIRVRDSGEGMPPDMLSNIFDMFFQSHSTLARSNGGIGVGLTLVKALVEMHGGTVSAHSEGPGMGSLFVVRLPCTDEPETVDKPPSAPAAAGSAHRVLIVEDNDDSRQMLRRLLEMDGYEVEAADDGVMGLETLRSGTFDVALVDIGLPELDGYEIAKRFRKERSDRDVYLVALTGYGREADRQAVLQAGFDEHLVKPLNPAELARVLNKPR